MKWLFITLLYMLFIGIYYNEKDKMKEGKYVLFLLLVISAVTSFLVLFFPNTPGLTQWVEAIFKPLLK